MSLVFVFPVIFEFCLFVLNPSNGVSDEACRSYPGAMLMGDGWRVLGEGAFDNLRFKSSFFALQGIFDGP